MLETPDVPVSVMGRRILVAQDKAKDQSEGGIVFSEGAKEKPFSGRIIDAGLEARSVLWDNGIDVTDHVWFAKFAGVKEEWDHITNPGKEGCDHSWSIAGRDDVSTRYLCHCGAAKAIEKIVILSCDDVLGSIELAERRRLGIVSYRRGQDSEGATIHIIDRKAA